MNDKLVKSKPARGVVSALVPVAAALLLVVIGGAWYGNYSQRWGPPPDMVAASAKLEHLPRQFGDWSLAEDLPFDEATRNMLECAGHVNRRYINQKTRQGVSLAIIVGPPGPTSVHTPEICFSSRAFQQAGERSRHNFGDAPGKSDSFWTLDFTSPNVLADGLRVYYAWSRGDDWEASESPRYEFAAAPYLYKLQLAAPVAAGAKAGDADVGQKFLEEFLQAAWPEGAAGIPN
ncbi:exosortase-associated EpsI family protein [Lacipirellula limnantheis]|uniref:Methanolan biosynthesis EpsI domain-containing protein n=1 Tax=Lacipirellula limnantheis TaxID=2528024 RepID=A0A517TY83_9BACT|nr:exosortase-associated EpsI family protein [Lacipirellula limnantheis]QDT73334.1 hypothetical protein I41_25230 [Lacipirellula limnantheis]